MTPEQLSALTVKLADPDLAALSDAEAAAAISAETESRYKLFFINKRTLAGLFGPTRAAAAMAGLKAAAQADASGTYQLVYDLLDTVGNNAGDGGGADVGSAIGQAQVDALQPVMGFTSEEAAAIKALGVETVRLYPEVHEGDIAWVRSQM